MKQKRSGPRFRAFNHLLNPIAAAVWLLHLANIPVSLLTAVWMSEIVTSATEGQTKQLLAVGLRLAALLIGFKLCECIFRIWLERKKSTALHRCRMDLYNRFLDAPLPVLYTSDSGQSRERLNDDFSAATGKLISDIPGLYGSLLSAAAYFIFIAGLSLPMAAALTAFALLQIIPPLIVKNFLEQNYTDMREVEAACTNFIIEAHHGFAVLKLYRLKDWYVKKLAHIHKGYMRTTNRAILAGQAEDCLDNFLSTILKYGTCALAGLLILYGTIPLDTGVKSIALSGSFFAAVNTAFSSITRFAVARQAEKRLALWYDEAERNDNSCRILAAEHNGNSCRDLTAERNDNNCRILATERDDDRRNLTAECGARVQDLQAKRGGSGSAPQNEAPSVSLSGVSVTFEDREIFHNASVCFPAHGICLIKGVNGAGKTTLFKLIAGLIPVGQTGNPDAQGKNPAKQGEILTCGISPARLSGRDFPRRIFYLPQEDAEFELTSQEFYSMVSDAAPAQALEIAAGFGLGRTQLCDTKISELSGGERKKVFLSLALVLNPQLLLLDEPTNSLDEQSKTVLIRALQRRPGPTLIISHDPVFDTVSNTAYRIEKGGIRLA